MKYMSWFGCEANPSISNRYLCKAYQPSVDYAHDGFPRFGGGETAWAYHIDPSNTFPAEPVIVNLTGAVTMGAAAVAITFLSVF